MKVVARSYLVMSPATAVVAPSSSGKGDGKSASSVGSFKIIEKSQVQANSRDYPNPICLAGTTAQRPLAGDIDMPAGGPTAGSFYYDSSLSVIVVADGQNGWRNPATGALI